MQLPGMTIRRWMLVIVAAALDLGVIIHGPLFCAIAALTFTVGVTVLGAVAMLIRWGNEGPGKGRMLTSSIPALTGSLFDESCQSRANLTEGKHEIDGSGRDGRDGHAGSSRRRRVLSDDPSSPAAHGFDAVSAIAVATRQHHGNETVPETFGC